MRHRCLRWTLVIAASRRKPAHPRWNQPCAAAKLWQHGMPITLDIASMNRRHSGEFDHMPVRPTLLAAAFISIAALATSPASAQILRYANQGALKSLDPYTLRETTTIAQHGHVYEGLVGRDKELKIVPALAESWETPEPNRWRFHLRHNVKFHNGDPFTADDVVFSADRVRAVGSNFTTLVPGDTKVVKVDDYPVDFITASPNPI